MLSRIGDIFLIYFVVGLKNINIKIDHDAHKTDNWPKTDMIGVYKNWCAEYITVI